MTLGRQLTLQDINLYRKILIVHNGEPIINRIRIEPCRIVKQTPGIDLMFYSFIVAKRAL